MKVLITGNRGFVGSATQKYLEELGIEVVGYDIMDNLDIRDPAQLAKCVEETRPERILHLAAIARFADADKDPLLALDTNVLGTRNVAMVAAKYHVPMVYSSTGSVYMPISEEPPIRETFKATGNSTYGCTKLMGELQIKHYTSPWIILRYSHLYGREKRFHGLIGGFLDRINRGLAPTLYGGKQSNDFCYIDDVVHANTLALNASWDKWNQVYNVGTGEEISAEEAGKLVCKLTGWKGKVEHVEGRTVDPQRFVYDTTKAETMLGFKARFSFEEGMRDMLKDKK